MRLEDDARCRFFFDVYPAFVKALHTLSSSDTRSVGSEADCHVVSLDNLRSALDIDIRELGVSFSAADAQRDVLGEPLAEALDAIEQILFMFESLIPNQKAIGSGANTAPQQLLEKFSKLVTLQHVVLKNEVDDPSSMISFGNEPKLYHQASTSARLFIRTMRRIQSSANGDDLKQSSWASQETQSTRQQSVTLEESRRQSDSTARLFELLDQAVCKHLERRHTGNLRLFGLKRPASEQLEFDVLLSICKSQNKEHWQQAYIGFSSSDEVNQIENGTLCVTLWKLRSRPLSRPLRMVASNTGIREVPVKKDRAQRHAKALKKTLSDVFRNEHMQRQTKPNYRELKHNEKRELGVKIATTFVKTFSAPLIRQRILDPEFIYLLEDESQSGGALSEAYVSFSIGSSNDVVDGVLEMENGDASILHLAAVLLELELESKIQLGDGVSDEEFDEETNELFGALERVHSEIQDNIDATFCDIIEECLQLYAESFEMLDSIGRSEIQTQLFNKVVAPLAHRLEIYRNPKSINLQSVPSRDKGKDYGIPKPVDTNTSRSVMCPIMEVNEGLGEMRNGAISAITVPWPISDPEFLAASTRNSRDWLDRMDVINAYMGQIRRANSTSGKVKIALLDTGCDLEATCFCNLSVDEVSITQHWHDWAGGSDVPLSEDSSKHGTSMAALLLRVAPHAEVFIGRVAKSSGDLKNATTQLIEAISHAARIWNADIVTMSFGFKSVASRIENRINEIVLQRKEDGRNILFLAAANNNGLNELELFPASHQDVISVRGTTHTGEFVPAYSPKPQPYQLEMLFGTLGQEVPYDPASAPGNLTVEVSGCSVATPILAGLVATIIQFAESSCPADERVQKAVRSKDGIQAIMHEMGAETSIHNHRCTYASPWDFFFIRNQNERVALIRHAVARLPRRK